MTELLFVQRLCECCGDSMNLGVFSDLDHAKRAIRLVAGEEEDELDNFDEEANVWYTAQPVVYYAIDTIEVNQVLYDFIPDDEENEEEEDA